MSSNQLTRYWIILVENDQYGYMWAMKKPLPFEKVTITVATDKRPKKVTGRVSKVLSGN